MKGKISCESIYQAFLADLWRGVEERLISSVMIAKRKMPFFLGRHLTIHLHSIEE
jgi:hypothetical protein